MPITSLLEQNCKLYPEDTALVELNPALEDDRRMTWREFELVESAHVGPYRREITWRVFNEKANRFANLLIERGIKKDDKVGILLMPGMAADLFRHLKDRSFSGSAQLPLHVGRDHVLRQTG